MTTYVRRNGKVVEKKSRAAPRRGSGLYIISDEMAPTRHMADNQYYTSKKKFRAATRAAGCVEVGNDVAPLLTPRRVAMPTRAERREAIRTALRRQLAGQPY